MSADPMADAPKDRPILIFARWAWTHYLVEGKSGADLDVHYPRHWRVGIFIDALDAPDAGPGWYSRTDNPYEDAAFQIVGWAELPADLI